MILPSILLAFAPVGWTPPASTSDFYAIRVGRAETVSKGTIEHAVILVEGGKIATIGEDLPIERGIPIIDRPDWVVIPGLVNAYSRLGLDGEGGDDMNPDARAFDELYPASEDYAEVVKFGVTTLGLYPAGNGIPGQAVAVRPTGNTPEEMRVHDPAYLKIIIRAAANSKKLLREGFKKADEYEAKEKKAREKWEKDQEAKKKKAPAKKPDEKAEEKKGEEKKGEEKKEEAKDEPKTEKPDAKTEEATYTPSEPEPKTKPFVDLRSGKLRALISISSAGEYLHMLDAIDKEKFTWDLRVPMTREIDLFYVVDKKTYDLDQDGIGDRHVRVVMEPLISLTPGTLRQRNLASELSRAGAKIVFIPRNDTLLDHERWLAHTAEMVNAGLPRDVALRALTLEPAELLGVGDRLGSLDKGKDANFVFLNGDPFEPTTRIQAVVLEGRVMFGEVGL
jgi:hypothetical protein